MDNDLKCSKRLQLEEAAKNDKLSKWALERIEQLEASNSYFVKELMAADRLSNYRRPNALYVGQANINFKGSEGGDEA